MSELCLNVCRLCVPHIMSLAMCIKKLQIVKFGAFAWYSVKIRVIFSVEINPYNFYRVVQKNGTPVLILR